MKRRDFLAASALLPVFVNRLPIGAPSSPLFSAIGSVPSDRVLVLVNLIGGNDGLNTLVPLDQYDKLAALRQNVLIPENKLINVDSTKAFHPSFGGMKSIWDSGRLGIIQDVGYPDQNRSHFRSSDIWNTGSPSAETWTTGWLGRHFDAVHPSFPSGFPNTQHPDPIAISIGSSVSETCQGIAGNFALTVNDPTNAGGILEGVSSAIPDTPYGDELSFVRTSISQANAYGSVVKDAADRGRNLVDYPENNTLAWRLSNVAKMIDGGLETKVYVVSLGGFDTHAAQVEEGDATTGEHAVLLQELGDALAAFQADINALGLGERVIGMTYSEFGRRIRSNAAFGTDHGTAAPAFLFGDCINAGVLGNNPTIDTGVDELEGVAMQYDFRDMYGSILEDWFGLDNFEVKSLLYSGYTKLPIIRDCNAVVSDLDHQSKAATKLSVAPSPFTNHVQLSFSIARKGLVSLTAYDVTGGVIETLFERRLPAGEQLVRVDTSSYPMGVVIFRLQEGEQVRVIRAIRQQ